MIVTSLIHEPPSVPHLAGIYPQEFSIVSLVSEKHVELQLDILLKTLEGIYPKVYVLLRRHEVNCLYDPAGPFYYKFVAIAYETNEGKIEDYKPYSDQFYLKGNYNHAYND